MESRYEYEGQNIYIINQLADHLPPGRILLWI
jgi:hypothetical protein